MFKKLIKGSVWLLLFALLFGCQLASGRVEDDSTPSVTPTIQPTATSTGEPTASATPMPIFTITPSSELAVACLPRHPDWPEYTVRSGDTLVHLARESGSTVTELARINCLEDTNLIFPGQVVRLPLLPQENPLPVINDSTLTAEVCAVLPAGAPVVIYGPDKNQIALLAGPARLLSVEPGQFTIELNGLNQNGRVNADIRVLLVGANCPDPVSAPSTECPVVLDGQGRVIIQPGTQVQQHCIEVSPGFAVEVQWPEAPAEFAMIEFWTRDANGSTNVIGVDQDDSDGASVIWTVPASPFNVRVYAIPYSNSAAATSGEVTVFTSD